MKVDYQILGIRAENHDTLGSLPGSVANRAAVLIRRQRDDNGDPIFRQALFTRRDSDSRTSVLGVPTLSYWHVEELLGERGVGIDHSTIQRWVVRYSPELAGQAECRCRQVGVRWRCDETYIRVKGRWCYLYRAVDKAS